MAITSSIEIPQGWAICEVCHGRGEREEQVLAGYDPQTGPGQDYVMVPCDFCEGQGVRCECCGKSTRYDCRCDGCCAKCQNCMEHCTCYDAYDAAEDGRD